MELKPKLFGPIWAEYDGSDAIKFAHSKQAESEMSFAKNSPVDTLLASLGHCIVMSIQWSAAQRKVDLNPFKVEVLGTKALDEPGRLQKIDVTVIGHFVDDSGLSERMLKQAKAICTVSNSLNCEVTLSHSD